MAYPLHHWTLTIQGDRTCRGNQRRTTQRFTPDDSSPHIARNLCPCPTNLSRRNCGFLIGPRDAAEIDEVRPCVNQQNRYHTLDPERFPLHAKPTISEEKTCVSSLRGGEPPSGQNHLSLPPDVGAYFSAEDTRAALGREPDATAEPLYPVDHVVIDAQVDHIAGAKMFRWAQHTFIQIAAYASER